MAKIPSLKTAWQAWKFLGRKFGDFQARLILSIFYFMIIAPFSLLVRFFSDPLSLKPGTAKGWILKWDAQRTELQRATQQF
jgi:hypothetical protein